MEHGTDITSDETAVLIPGTEPSRHISALGSGPSTHTSLAEEGRFLPCAILGSRYRIIGLLGKGMGEVYRATDLMLGQSVALKLLSQTASANLSPLERFYGEVRFARQVSHPNICRVFDIGEADGLPFISMECVDGEDLSSLLHRIGRLSSGRAVVAARQGTPSRRLSHFLVARAGTTTATRGRTLPARQSAPVNLATPFGGVSAHSSAAQRVSSAEVSRRPSRTRSQARA